MYSESRLNSLGCIGGLVIIRIKHYGGSRSLTYGAYSTCSTVKALGENNAIPCRLLSLKPKNYTLTASFHKIRGNVYLVAALTGKIYRAYKLTVCASYGAYGVKLSNVSSIV